MTDQQRQPARALRTEASEQALPGMAAENFGRAQTAASETAYSSRTPEQVLGKLFLEIERLCNLRDRYERIHTLYRWTIEPRFREGCDRPSLEPRIHYVRRAADFPGDDPQLRSRT